MVSFSYLILAVVHLINHASNSCSNTSHTRGGVPTQIVNVQQVQTKRYVNTRNNCVAYGYDNTCVAW